MLTKGNYSDRMNSADAEKEHKKALEMQGFLTDLRQKSSQKTLIKK